MPTIQEPPFKDEKQLCFNDWEKVNIEMLNGLLMSNYYASNIITDHIPKHLQKSNGEFPSIINFGKDMYALFSRIVFGGTCTINAGRISLDPGKTLVLNLYPNIEPLASWDEFNIETNSDSKLSFKMNKLDNSIVYNEKTFDSFNKKINIPLGANVSSELKEMVITITNRGITNVLITNIDYQFTIKSRLHNLLSDINAGFLNGKTEKQLLDLFLSMITKPFLEAIMPPVPAINPYPVGAIYCSVSSTSPASIFGGTWVQIKDRFLLCAGDIYKAGQIGGNATHALSQSEMPSHGHPVSSSAGGGGTTSSNTHSHRVQYFQNGRADGPESRPHYQGPYPSDTLVQPNTHSHTIPDHVHNMTVGASGGNAAHNNMPPYLVIYVWQRTA